MLTGTLVTIAGFVPIGFAASSAGEYTFSIFAVVAIALIVSWFVAVLFAPLLGMAILKAPKGAGRPSPKPGAAARAIRASWRSRCACAGSPSRHVAMFVAAVFGALPLVPRQFFPASDRTELLVDLTLPQNASIFASEARCALDAALAQDPDVARWSTYVGRGAIRFYLPLNVQLPNPSSAQAVVVAKDLPSARAPAAAARGCWPRNFPRRLARLSARARPARRLAAAVPRRRAPTSRRVREIALELAQLLAEAPGAWPASTSTGSSRAPAAHRVDQDEARRSACPPPRWRGAQRRGHRHAGHPGARRHLPDQRGPRHGEERLSLDTLRSLQVPLPGGRTVPLAQFATFDYAQEPRWSGGATGCRR
jgi:multidrug efflux pump